jgi:hypothetical protein
MYRSWIGRHVQGQPVRSLERCSMTHQTQSMQLVPAVLALLVGMVLFIGHVQTGAKFQLPLSLLFMAVSVSRVRRWRHGKVGLSDE